MPVSAPMPDTDVNCEACGSPTYRVRDLEVEIGKPAEQLLWHCDACDHVQVHPMPTPEQISSYYGRRPQPGLKRRPSSWAGGHVKAAPSYIRRLDRISAGRAATLLDVGFGSGSFLRAAQARGYVVTGLDFNARNFHPDFPCDVREGQLLPGVFPNESFDVVSAHHVLEHVEDLPQALRTIHGLLRKDGHLLVEVPHDLRSLIKRLKRLILRRGHSGFTRLQHLRFFTVRSLRSALERAGFQIDLCRSIPIYELVRFPQSLLVTALAPLEYWTGWGHNLEAIARKTVAAQSSRP
jgi:SAM-dependent methyltransferase